MTLSMNKRVMVAVAALALGGGCGGDTTSINGDWFADLGGSCGMGVTFNVAEKGYVTALICKLTDGTLGAEMEAGDADFSVAKTVSIVPRSASCPTSDHTPDKAGYSFSGGNLVLATKDGVIELVPNDAEAGGKSLVITFGCWDMGKLRPHPVQDL